jgi:putative phosphoesterase
VIPEVLDQLGELAPVHAVLGNNDGELVGTLPEELVVELDGVRVAMVHDSGPGRGREARLRRRFPDADVVVFGHSHIPWDAPGHDGQWLLNPGSPTERRRQPHRSMATLDVADGRVLGTRLVVVDDSPG